MPEPPRFRDFTEINFVISYALLGCGPSPWLVWQVAKRPLTRLAILFFGLDYFDMAQALFAPKGGRKRLPGRKGRKRRRPRPGLPDINDFIGGQGNPEKGPLFAIPLGARSFGFQLFQAYEGISFFMAVIETGQDAAYEGMLGAILVDPSQCQDLARILRTIPNPYGVGYFGVSPYPLAFPEPEFQQGFVSHNTWVQCTEGHANVAVQVVVTPGENVSSAEGRVRLRNTDSGALAFSEWADLQPGDTQTLNASISVGPFDIVELSWELGHSVMEILSGQVFGYEVPPGFLPE
jgi:hypothetical protein